MKALPYTHNPLAALANHPHSLLVRVTLGYVSWGMYPPNNHIGTVLLGRLLVQICERQGLKIGELTWAMDLNRAYICIGLEHPRVPLQAILAGLQGTGIDDDMVIALYDAREMVTRVLYPSPESEFHKPTKKELDACVRTLEAESRRLLRLTRLVNGLSAFLNRFRKKNPK